MAVKTPAKRRGRRPKRQRIRRRAREQVEKELGLEFGDSDDERSITRKSGYRKEASRSQRKFRKTKHKKKRPEINPGLVVLVHEIHSLFDTNGDGYLNERELVELKNKTSASDDQISYEFACQMVDADPSKGLSTENLYELYSMCPGGAETSIKDDYSKVFSAEGVDAKIEVPPASDQDCQQADEKATSPNKKANQDKSVGGHPMNEESNDAVETHKKGEANDLKEKLVQCEASTRKEDVRTKKTTIAKESNNMCESKDTKEPSGIGKPSARTPCEATETNRRGEVCLKQKPEADRKLESDEDSIGDDDDGAGEVCLKQKPEADGKQKSHGDSIGDENDDDHPQMEVECTQPNEGPKRGGSSRPTKPNEASKLNRLVLQPTLVCGTQELGTQEEQLNHSQGDNKHSESQISRRSEEMSQEWPFEAPSVSKEPPKKTKVSRTEEVPSDPMSESKEPAELVVETEVAIEKEKHTETQVPDESQGNSAMRNSGSRSQQSQGTKDFAKRGNDSNSQHSVQIQEIPASQDSDFDDLQDKFEKLDKEEALQKQRLWAIAKEKRKITQKYRVEVDKCRHRRQQKQKVKENLEKKLQEIRRAIARQARELSECETQLLTKKSAFAKKLQEISGHKKAVLNSLAKVAAAKRKALDDCLHD